MRERSLEDLELNVYTLRHAVVDCLNDSRGRKRETAHKAMRSWRELRAMVIILAGCRDNRKVPQFTYSHPTDATDA
jgi:hypothetical protein